MDPNSREYETCLCRHVTRGEIDGFATDDVDFIKNEEPVEEAAPAAQ